MYPVHYLDTVDSTNRIAKEFADSGEPHGTAVLAARQTGGRGRLGKVWESIPGKGLYCSIIVRPEIDIEKYAQITLVTGVAVAQVVEELTGKECMLKWPNDIYLNGRKCGGILAESSSMNVADRAMYCVIGIGLNINSKSEDFPVELQSTATSFFMESGQHYNIRELFEQVRDQLLSELHEFSTTGFAAILDRWRKRDYLLGRQMECVGHDGTIIRGIALGPDSDGRLFLRDKDGVKHAVLSGDVRLAGKQVDRLSG